MALSPEDKEALENKLGYSFQSSGLLQTALTHPTFANIMAQKGEPIDSNQRLEFLGDAVLDLVMAELLYRDDPKAKPGLLTQRRIHFVDEKSLAEIGQELELERFLIAGPGAIQTGVLSLPSTLADAFEALLAAAYLDGGLDAAKTIIEKCFLKRLGEAEKKEDIRDSKSVLQELAQERFSFTPIYRTLRQKPRFHVEVNFAIGRRARGQGDSKRQAEQDAAKQALFLLQNDDRPSK